MLLLGMETVEKLEEYLNRPFDPRHLEGWGPAKPPIDAEALEFGEEDESSPAEVPKRGRWVLSSSSWLRRMGTDLYLHGPSIAFIGLIWLILGWITHGGFSHTLIGVAIISYGFGHFRGAKAAVEEAARKKQLEEMEATRETNSDNHT